MYFVLVTWILYLTPTLIRKLCWVHNKIFEINKLKPNYSNHPEKKIILGYFNDLYFSHFLFTLIFEILIWIVRVSQDDYSANWLSPKIGHEACVKFGSKSEVIKVNGSTKVGILSVWKFVWFLQVLVYHH